MSESVPGSPNQELLRRLSYLSRGDDSGAEDGAEEEAVVEEYSSTEVKALPTPHYHLQKWFPDDPSSIPKETQQLWLDRPSTPLIDPDCFARRRNFVVSDVHVLLVNSDNEERRRLKLSLEALGYVVSGAASFPVAQRLLREHAGDYHAVLVDHKLRAQGVPAHRSAVWAAPHTACVDLLSWARGVAALKEVAFIVTADEVGASPPLHEAAVLLSIGET